MYEIDFSGRGIVIFDDKGAESVDTLHDVRQFLAARHLDDPRAVVVAALRPRFTRLPQPLKSTVHDLIARGQSIPSAIDLARQCAISVRTADRSMSSAGLGSMRRILIVAQAVRAYELLHIPEVSLGRVASRIGFVSVRPAEKIVQKVTGESMRDLRQSSDFTRFLPNIIGYLNAPSIGSLSRRREAFWSTIPFQVKSLSLAFQI